MKQLVRNTRRKRRGFTMVEVTISAVILGSMMGSLFLVHSTGENVASQATLEDEADARLTRSLMRVADELRFVIDTSIWEGLGGLNPSTRVLTFRSVASLEGGVAVPGTLNRVEVLPELGDPSDGLDNDGDGLVDECSLYLTRDFGGANEMRVALCNGVRELYVGETLDLADENGNGLVDEPGFHIERIEDRLVIRLAVDVARSDGAQVTRSGEASIRIRN